MKLYGAYHFAVGTQIGAFFYGGSGTPITTYVDHGQPDRGLRRRPRRHGPHAVLQQTDLLVSHELPMAGNKRLRFELNVLNLFNQKTARHIFNYLNRGAGLPRRRRRSTSATRTSRKGYDYNALIRATPDGANAYDPRYGMDDLFEPGTQGQFIGEVPVLRFEVRSS